MNIGLFDPYLPTLGGGEKYILTIASCLSKSNNVSIFWNLSEEFELKNKVKQKLDVDLENVKFEKNIFSNDTSFLSRVINTRKFDYVIFLSDGSIPLVSSKLILHFQFPVEWVGIDPKTKIKLRRVNKVICNSEFTKSYIDKKFGIESKVLYPPVFIRKENSKKENIILHVGRFGIDREGSNFKKQDVMIDVFKKMVKKGLKGWKFVVIVGVNDVDREKIKKLKKAGIGFPVEIIENPVHKLLWEFYNKSKIYWHASGFGEDLKAHPEKAEHFGISTVEAMGAGSVPVVINAGGQREIVEDKINGFLWNNLEEFEDISTRLIKDDKLLGKVSKAAIERSKYFSGDRFCRELKQIIK